MTNVNIEITDRVNLSDWMSLNGVITFLPFFGRVIAAILILIIPFSLTVVLSSLDETNQVIKYILVLNTFLGLVSFPLGIWILLASFTKRYRTKGMPAPFFFALVTPIMPLMLLITWMFSSKELATQNTALAVEQDLLRKTTKRMRKNTAASYKTNAKPTNIEHPVVQNRQKTVWKDNAPTVRRRR